MSFNSGNNPVPLKGELLRKFIHMASASIPVGYLYLERSTVLTILVPLLAFLIIIELLKYVSKPLYSVYTKLFGYMLREHETDKNCIRINGASWLLLGDVLCILVFPQLIAITGMLILSLSDSISAIAGRLLGRAHFAPNRSYAGSVTFFLIGCTIIFLSPKYLYAPAEYIIGITAVAITTFADAGRLPVDDNFTIPVISSGLIYLLYLIFLPGVFV